MCTRIPILVVVAAGSVAAQEQTRDTARVDPVVVTATRTPLDRAMLPVAVTLISGDDLRARGIATVADALRDVTSAYVAQAGSQGATTSLFLRGGESKYVKVLIDGVPANDPGGSFDFASLTTDNVERIEVVRGPASVVHGADAVTGVVHVITRGGRGVAAGEISMRAGMAPRHATASGGLHSGRYAPMRAFDAGASLRGEASPTMQYSLALARHQSSGLYVLNNEYRNNVMSGRIEWSPATRTDVRLSLRYTDLRYNYPTDGGGTASDPNAYRVEDRSLLGIEVERRVREAVRVIMSIRSSIGDAGTDDDVDNANDASFVSQDNVRRRGAELRVHATSGGNALLSLGVQMEQQDQRSQMQSHSTLGVFASAFKAARRNLGVYTEAVITPHARVALTLGGRLDGNQAFGRFLTGRAGVSVRPFDATRLRATIGNAFREPTFAENYSTGFVTGNPDLEPERTTTWDIGVEQSVLTDRVRVEVTGFAQRFINMIDYEPSTSACGYSYCNVAEATANGVETELRARVVGPWWLGASATFLETEVVTPGYDVTSGGLYKRGESLIRRPERNVTVDLAYRGAPLSASARLLAVGARHDRDFRTFPSTPVTLSAYERLDIGAEYRVRREHAITLRVENATNAYYENVFNFLTPRRTVWLGVRSQF